MNYEVVIEYLVMYLVSVLLIRVFATVERRNNNQENINYFSLTKVVLILIVFLILSSLLVYPMAFILIMAPLENNVFVHLFLISIAPLILFHLKNIINRQTKI